ncbi:hypothetical protein G9A89_008910 [Geosiphon pyriformis]|nr:hypothetical protein G9A89_008910 [Geosiphon pyriformis]
MINEEISTIFVVGFPDDMQEREFQNMFIFSPGFEAATLKVPHKDSSAEDSDEAINSGGSANGNGVNARKQIIGFAKFRSRIEALEARDILSGRKVDAEKGSVLKAEMAKKNLHTKRGLSNEQNISAYPLITPTKRFPTPSNINTSNYEPYLYGAPPLPSDLLSPQDYGYEFSDVSAYTPTTPTTPVFPDQSPFPTATRGSFDPSNGAAIVGGMVGAPRGLVNGRYTKSFLDNEELNYFPKTNPVEILPNTLSTKVSNTNGFSSAILLNDDLNNRMGTLSMNPPILVPQMAPTGPSLPMQPFRPPNPADQNPPCNTLYVGNLPMNTNEEELKEMFSKCPGYKRMCFRTKQNGPMCFVEFEDVQYATQAMTELYGNPLSNSVKGGIRLSFSKNPLGVRSNSNHHHNGDRRDSNFNPERRDSTYSLLSDRSSSNINLERRESNYGLERRDSNFAFERRDSAYERFNNLERRDSGSGFSLNTERRDPYFMSERREAFSFDPQLA